MIHKHEDEMCRNSSREVDHCKFEEERGRFK